MTNEQRCDFTALIQAYRSKESQNKNRAKNRNGDYRNIELDIYY
jgi:hypothetical protein